MFIWALIYALVFLLILAFVYTIYKFIWYIVKLLVLNIKLKKLNGYDITVVRKRSLLKNVFAQKGRTDFEVKTRRGVYAVSIVSFISTHSRWNIEKSKDDFYIEVRKYNNMFYRVYNNSGTEPEHSKDYRRETRFMQNKLYLEKEPDPKKEHIMLIYPKPKLLTFTTTRVEYLTSGTLLESYKVLYATDFWELLKK